MSKTFQNIIFDTEEQLQFISLEIEDITKRSEASIIIILKALEQLKTHVIKSKFNYEQQPINQGNP